MQNNNLIKDVNDKKIKKNEEKKIYISPKIEILGNMSKLTLGPVADPASDTGLGFGLTS